MNSIAELIADIGLRPTPTHTLDRKNNSGHYEVGNLGWATRKEQANNRRPYPKNRKGRKRKGDEDENYEVTTQPFL